MPCAPALGTKKTILYIYITEVQDGALPIRPVLDIFAFWVHLDFAQFCSLSLATLASNIVNITAVQ